MPRGIRSLRWLETGQRVFQVEAYRSRYFFGIVSETSDPNCWHWRCFAGEGYEPSAKEAKAKIESLVLPIFRYAESTTWGDNTHAMFELHPVDGALVRAAGSFEHCRYYYEQARVSKDEPLVTLLDVRPLKRRAA